VFAPHFAVTTRGGDLASTPIPGADLILAGTVLNELPPAARVPLAERALAALAEAARSSSSSPRCATRRARSTTCATR